MLIVISAAAVFLGAALQSATGFGFAIVCAPLLVAALGPQGGVSAAIVLGLAVNALTLGGERRPSAVLRGEVARLVAWSLPGLVLGALALTVLPEAALQLLVAGAVLAALAVRLSTRWRIAAPPGGEAVVPAGGGRRRTPVVASGRRQPTTFTSPSGFGWRTAAAGASAGALSTSTSLSGPPLVLYLLGRGVAAEQTRDTLAAVFAALGVLSLAALLVVGALDLRAVLGALVLAAFAGHLLGRRIFAAFSDDRHEQAILVVLAAAAVAALVAGLL